MDIHLIKQSAEVRDKVKLFLSRTDTASDSQIIKELEMLKFTNPVLAAFIKKAIERALAKLREKNMDTQDRGDEPNLLKTETEETNERENEIGKLSPLDVHFVQLNTYINEKRSAGNLKDEITEIEKWTVEKKEKKQSKIIKLLRKQAEEVKKEKKKAEKVERKRIKGENKKSEKQKRKQHKEQKRVEKEERKKAEAQKKEIEKQNKRQQKEEKKAEKERKKLAKSERERIRLILAENGFNLVDEEDEKKEKKNFGRIFGQILTSLFSWK